MFVPWVVLSVYVTSTGAPSEVDTDNRVPEAVCAVTDPLLYPNRSTRSRSSHTTLETPETRAPCEEVTTCAFREEPLNAVESTLVILLRSRMPIPLSSNTPLAILVTEESIRFTSSRYGVSLKA